MSSRARLSSAVWILTSSIIVSVSTFFRFFYVFDLTSFGSEQGTTLLASRNLILGHFNIDSLLLLHNHQHSLTSLIFTFLLTPVMTLGVFHPLVVSVTSTIISLFAIFLLGYFAYRFLSPVDGLSLALLAAISPLYVNLTYQLSPNVLRLLIAGWLISVTYYLEYHQRRYLLLTIVCSLALASSSNWGWLYGVPIFFWLVPGLRAKYKVCSPKTKYYLQVLFATSLGAALIGKTLALGGESISQWWHFWLALTIDVNWLSATWFFLLLTMGGVYFRKHQNESGARAVRGLMTISLIMMTVLNEMSPELMSTLATVVLILTVMAWHEFSMLVQKILKAVTRPESAWLVTTCSLLLLLSLGSYHWLSKQSAGEFKQATQVANLISMHSKQQNYNFIYRSTADLSPSADDHYQYLLWRQEKEPNLSAYHFLKDPYLEKWLLAPKPRAKQTLILYEPKTTVNEYVVLGDVYDYGDVLIEVITEQH